uniref:G-protein coupled receptors family 3 profile domain-containing protein n=1 Tax=Vombatus ursinus TaxID=29139 RepID=A0A4X2LAM9_VOMUR
MISLGYSSSSGIAGSKGLVLLTSILLLIPFLPPLFPSLLVLCNATAVPPSETHCLEIVPSPPPPPYCPTFFSFLHHRLMHKNHQQVLALVFAVEEINQNLNLLPNITLGYHLYNTYHSDERTLESSLKWLSGQSPTMPNYSCRAQDKSVHHFHGTQNDTHSFSFQTTYGPFEPLLNDKVQFTSLYQMALRDSFLSVGIVQLLFHFGWTWVGLVSTDDMRGEEFLWNTAEEMSRSNICVAFTEKIPVSERRQDESHVAFMPRIIASSTKVIIIHGDADSLMILRHSQPLIFTSLKLWIITSDLDITLKAHHYDYSFHGALVFKHQTSEAPGFSNFLKSVNLVKYPEDTFLKSFWHLTFNCPDDPTKLEGGECSPNASLEDLPLEYFEMTVSSLSYSIYNSVCAVAWALHDILRFQQLDISSTEHYTKCLTFFMKKKQYFNNSAGDQVILDEQKNPVAKYDIMNYLIFFKQNEILVKVGQFIPKSLLDQNFTISENSIVWGISQTAPESVCNESCGPGFRKQSCEGKPACCFDCVQCPEEEISNQRGNIQIRRDNCLPKTMAFLTFKESFGLTLTCTALSFSVLTVLILVMFVKFRDTPIVKANNTTLSYTLLISLTLCFLCSMLFIGRPTSAACLLQQTVFGIVFTVAVSSILAKTIIVVLAFKVTRPGSKMKSWVHPRVFNFVVFICSMIQVTLCGIWLVTSPPFPGLDLHSEPADIIIVCKIGSVIAFYGVLGYIGFLALGSFIVAFLARNLPDTFNEAKFITFGMLIFCSVWLSFIPAYQNPKGKAMVIVEIFCIFASSAGLLGCIFLPKCCVILLRPERNILEYLNIWHMSCAKVRGLIICQY